MQRGVSLNAAFTPPFAHRREQLVASAASHGVRLARSDAFWEGAEPLTPSVFSRLEGSAYDWHDNDVVAGTLARHGIRWWPVLDYAPRWALRPPSMLHAPPRDPRQYARYAAAFARRYGRGGDFWRENPRLTPQPVAEYEIWNEPDSSHFWKPRAEPGRYLDLYLRARAAIKAVDPLARVVVGGLTPNPGFVAAMLRSRPAAVGHIDAVGLHPYARTLAGVLEHVRSMRATLDRLGESFTPLELTEVGWQDRPRDARYYAPPGEKADDVAAALQWLPTTDCGIGSVLVFAWTTPQEDPRGIDDWYGLQPPAGGETPSTRAVARSLSLTPARPGTTTSCGRRP